VAELHLSGLALNKIGKAAAAMLNRTGSIWSLNQMKRGLAYEEILKANRRNIPGYKVIDDFVLASGKATSLKTMDLSMKSYTQNAGKGIYSTSKTYIDDLARFEGAARGGANFINRIKSKVTELGIPKGATQHQVMQLNRAI